ncbi:MAG: MOSC domain-containing protein [Myxococcaceae bacterium]|nr:MOSC domain-containing protein [Myxococcaceae bacterium]
MRGTVVGLGLCLPGRQVESVPVERLELWTEGIVGDRHFGPTLVAGPRQKAVRKGTVLPNTRQVSLVSREETAAIAAALELARLDFTWLAANVELDGVPALTSLAPRSRLVFEGGVVLLVDGENEPCRKVGRVIAEHTGATVESTFVRAAAHRRGLVAFVGTPGTLRVGESVRVEAP